MPKTQGGVDDPREKLRQIVNKRQAEAVAVTAQVVSEKNDDQRVAQNLEAKQYLSTRGAVEQPFYLFIRTLSGREYIQEMIDQRSKPLITANEKMRKIGELLATKIVGHIPVEAIEYIAIASDQDEVKKYKTLNLVM